jgi:hypothetical protein
MILIARNPSQGGGQSSDSLNPKIVEKSEVNVPTIVNIPALILPILSPKFNKPTANPPSTTVKFNQDKKVLFLSSKLKFKH